MSNHRGPEGTAPDDVRCEALVKARSGYFYEWTKRDHRCPRRANQMRGQIAVCHAHARSKAIERFEVQP